MAGPMPAVWWPAEQRSRVVYTRPAPSTNHSPWLEGQVIQQPNTQTSAKGTCKGKTFSFLRQTKQLTWCMNVSWKQAKQSLPLPRVAFNKSYQLLWAHCSTFGSLHSNSKQIKNHILSLLPYLVLDATYRCRAASFPHQASSLAQLYVQAERNCDATRLWGAITPWSHRIACVPCEGICRHCVEPASTLERESCSGHC